MAGLLPSALADYPKFVPVPEYDSSPYSKLATEDRDRQCGEASLPAELVLDTGSPFPGLEATPTLGAKSVFDTSTERVGASSEPQKAPHLLCVLGMVLTEIPKHLETIRLCSADRAANDYRRSVKLGWTMPAEGQHKASPPPH